MAEPLHVEKTLLDPKMFTKAAYVSKHVKGAYIATRCQPDVLFQLSKCNNVQEPNKEDTKT